MNDAIQIRSACIDDLDMIVTFNDALARETEGIDLTPQTLRQGVEWALRNPELCPYFLAHANDGIVGQCQITSEWSDWRSRWIWWFQSVYVMAEHRRQGVFRKLFAHVRSLAIDRGDVCALRLYVVTANDRARKTYSEMGMRDSGYVVYESPLSDELHDQHAHS